jgi:hypothetical protein
VHAPDIKIDMGEQGMRIARQLEIIIIKDQPV